MRSNVTCLLDRSERHVKGGERVAKKSKSRDPQDNAETAETVHEAEALMTEAPDTEKPDSTPEPDDTGLDDADKADLDEIIEEPIPELEEPTPEPEPIEPESVQERAARSIEHHDSASNSVFLPAILGGLIAAGLGFAVAYYMIPRADPGLESSVSENAAAIDILRSDLETAAAATPPAVDLYPITEEINTLRTDLTSELAALDGRITDLDDRLTTLEKQPSSDGTLQDSALEAYQRELDGLRSQVEEQAGAAIAQLESTRAEAEAIEQAALDAARAAQVRAALAQIQIALAEGTPMAAALTDLESALGGPVPDALQAVSEGAPTLAKLQADFPNAARAALAAARSGGASGEDSSAFGAFLREQLNVRSVAPRDGDDADAILSRAQAAVSNGQLQTALDEVSALPDVAQSQLAEWMAVAKTRVAAVQAADDVSLSLNVN